MLYPSHFNNQLIRKYLVAFGSFFDKMTVVRTKDDGTQQRIVVPIEYGPKERWLTRLVQDPDFTQGVAQIVPRMSYELSGFVYDSSRKLITLNQMTFPSTDAQKLARQYVGVPYNLTVELNILTKYQTDAFQLVEQILPFFTPDLSFAVNVIPTLGIVDQIPLTIASVSHSDNYEGNFETRRVIIWTIAFDMKVNIYGPVKTAGRIEEVIVDLYNVAGDLGDPPIFLETEDTTGDLLLEDPPETAGRLTDEDTTDAMLETGRVARIDVKVIDSPLPGGNVASTVTITDSNGDILRNVEGIDEST